MSLLIEICSWIFILLGSFLLLTGSLGLIRLPDFWSRLHGASISDTGGVLFLILGMMLHVTTIWVFFKLLAIAIFIFISSPTASHAIANAALLLWDTKKRRGKENRVIYYNMFLHSFGYYRNYGIDVKAPLCSNNVIGCF